MIIKLANEQDLLSLWEETEQKMAPTTQFFYNNIVSGNAEFWTWTNNNSIVGELYVFKKLEDEEFANGIDKVYLCAFRIIKEFRGQGYGTKLLTAVVEHIKNMGFKLVTIGVDETEIGNIRLYKRLGFTNKVKDSYIDPCNVDYQQKPKQCAKMYLLQKEL